MLTGLGSLLKPGDKRFELPPIANPNGKGAFKPEAPKPIETKAAVSVLTDQNEEEKQEIDESAGFIFCLAAAAISQANDHEVGRLMGGGVGILHLIFTISRLPTCPSHPLPHASPRPLLIFGGKAPKT